MTTKAQHAATQPPLGGATGEAPPGPEPSGTAGPVRPNPSPSDPDTTVINLVPGTIAPARTEFPVSASLKAYLPPYKESTDDPRQFDIFITMRGESGKDVMERLAGAIEWVCKHGGTGTIWPAGTQVHQPAPSPIPADVAMAGPPGAGGMGPNPDGTPVRNEKGYPGFTDAAEIKMLIDSRSMGPRLEFCGLPGRPGVTRKWPEEYVSGWGEDAINKLLEPLGLEFKAGTVEAKPVRVHFKLGNQKTKEVVLPDGTKTREKSEERHHDITRLEWLP